MTTITLIQKHNSEALKSNKSKNCCGPLISSLMTNEVIRLKNIIVQQVQLVIAKEKNNLNLGLFHFEKSEGSPPRLFGIC